MSKKSPNSPSNKKRPAKRKKIATKKSGDKVKLLKTKATRKQSPYLILQSAISKYCKDRYQRLMADKTLSNEDKAKIKKTCSKKEISEIYQSLKLRYTDNQKFSSEVLRDAIEEKLGSKLGYLDAPKIPSFLKRTEWFSFADLLVGNDGLFFKLDDVINVNASIFLSDIENGGVWEVYYQDLQEVFLEEIYPELRQFIDENPEYNNSPIPIFVLNEDLTDLDNRIFFYDLLDTDEREREPKEEKKPKEDKKDIEKEIDDLDFDEETTEPEKKESVSSDIDIEIEKEKTKQKQADLDIEREKTIQKALDALMSGKISEETFNKLIDLK